MLERFHFGGVEKYERREEGRPQSDELHHGAGMAGKLRKSSDHEGSIVRTIDIRREYVEKAPFDARITQHARYVARMLSVMYQTPYNIPERIICRVFDSKAVQVNFIDV